jgi:hypothetical protein
MLISPTAAEDSLQKELGVSPELTFTDLKQAPQVIDHLFKIQKRKIAEQGSVKAPKIAIILDDCMADNALMKSGQFMQLFTRGRHANLGVFVCLQALKSRNSGLPRPCLLNAGAIYAFGSSAEEISTLAECFCPPGCKVTAFAEYIFNATREKHTFLHINNRVPADKRYRKNIADEYLNLDSLR